MQFNRNLRNVLENNIREYEVNAFVRICAQVLAVAHLKVHISDPESSLQFFCPLDHFIRNINGLHRAKPLGQGKGHSSDATPDLQHSLVTGHKLSVGKVRVDKIPNITLATEEEFVFGPFVPLACDVTVGILAINRLRQIRCRLLLVDTTLCGTYDATSATMNWQAILLCQIARQFVIVEELPLIL